MPLLTSGQDKLIQDVSGGKYVGAAGKVLGIFVVGETVLSSNGGCEVGRGAGVRRKWVRQGSGVSCDALTDGCPGTFVLLLGVSCSSGSRAGWGAHPGPARGRRAQRFRHFAAMAGLRVGYPCERGSSHARWPPSSVGIMVHS